MTKAQIKELVKGDIITLETDYGILDFKLIEPLDTDGWLVKVIGSNFTRKLTTQQLLFATLEYDVDDQAREETE